MQLARRKSLGGFLGTALKRLEAFGACVVD